MRRLREGTLQQRAWQDVTRTVTEDLLVGSMFTRWLCRFMAHCALTQRIKAAVRLRHSFFHFMLARASKVLCFYNQKRRPYVFDDQVFHFTIPRASKVLRFYNQNRRRRKVGFHFTIPRASEVLCFYNQNHRHRKVETFSI